MSIVPINTLKSRRDIPALKELILSLNLTLGIPFIQRIKISKNIMAKKYGVTCENDTYSLVYGANVRLNLFEIVGHVCYVLVTAGGW